MNNQRNQPQSPERLRAGSERKRAVEVGRFKMQRGLFPIIARENRTLNRAMEVIEDDDLTSVKHHAFDSAHLDNVTVEPAVVMTPQNAEIERLRREVEQLHAERDNQNGKDGYASAA